MTDEPELAMLSRRKALSLFGLVGVSALTAPAIPLTAFAAAAQTIPQAFDQVDKPLPGEGGAARTSPEVDKPIPTDLTRRRRHRRKQHPSHHKSRGERHARSQPGSPEDKPK